MIGAPHSFDELSNRRKNSISKHISPSSSKHINTAIQDGLKINPVSSNLQNASTVMLTISNLQQTATDSAENKILDRTTNDRTSPNQKPQIIEQQSASLKRIEPQKDNMLSNEDNRPFLYSVKQENEILIAEIQLVENFQKEKENARRQRRLNILNNLKDNNNSKNRIVVTKKRLPDFLRNDQKNESKSSKGRKLYHLTEEIDWRRKYKHLIQNHPK